jgi:hypothetical protein
VIEALGRLRNTRDRDRPVSLYGGMVELPLIATRDDGARPAPVVCYDEPYDGGFSTDRDPGPPADENSDGPGRRALLLRLSGI